MIHLNARPADTIHLSAHHADTIRPNAITDLADAITTIILLTSKSFL
jgi:hypothetical protein